MTSLFVPDLYHSLFYSASALLENARPLITPWRKRGAVARLKPGTQFEWRLKFIRVGTFSFLALLSFYRFAERPRLTITDNECKMSSPSTGAGSGQQAPLKRRLVSISDGSRKRRLLESASAKAESILAELSANEKVIGRNNPY